MTMKETGKDCQYQKCPGRDKNSNKNQTRGYRTRYQCEECSIEKGKSVWLCNTTKNIDGKSKEIRCHVKYHKELYFVGTGSTECSVISDLTEDS